MAPSGVNPNIWQEIEVVDTSIELPVNGAAVGQNSCSGSADVLSAGVWPTFRKVKLGKVIKILKQLNFDG